MMPRIGIYLLYLAIALRGGLVFAQEPHFGLVISLLGAYGLLLLAESLIIASKPQKTAERPNLPPGKVQNWRAGIYLLVLTSVASALMAVPETQDFFALLFIPPSLKAIQYFGRKPGFLIIGFYSLLIISPLLGAEDGPIFGFVMGLFFSSLCFLFGSYAHQIQKSADLRSQNQQTLKDLRLAHHQLQSYTDQASALAAEQERNRLARELHDSVTQTMFSMNLATQSARLLWNKQSTDASQQLIHLERLATSALGEIQTLESHLRSQVPAEKDLPQALRRLAAERQARDGLNIRLQVAGSGSLSEAESAGLYAIASEALTNVLKHSAAREAIIRVSFNENAQVLEVEDHGRGFDPRLSGDQPGHVGLSVMAERASEIGWELSIVSQPQQGTLIRVQKNRSRIPK